MVRMLGILLTQTLWTLVWLLVLALNSYFLVVNYHADSIIGIVLSCWAVCYCVWFGSVRSYHLFHIIGVIGRHIL